MKSTRILISGYVQGVFFRSNVRKVANGLNIKGFVRNIPDGKVEVVAQGDKDPINQLIDFCKRGPPLAQIDCVAVSYEDYEEFTGFEVRY